MKLNQWEPGFVDIAKVKATEYFKNTTNPCNEILVDYCGTCNLGLTEEAGIRQNVRKKWQDVRSIDDGWEGK